jgi:predicted metal-dependent hydrolase
MQIAHLALKNIAPTTVATIEVKYSAKFKEFNANIAHHRIKNQFIIKLSHKWRDVDETILLGLFELLFAKILKKKYISENIKLYESFLKNLEKYAPVEQIDPILHDSFSRMNTLYFYGTLDTPNLVWGQKNKRKMGHYDYIKDTIMISSTLQNHADLVDYVMYHEMLHKKHKYYKTQTGRSMHHHTAFRDEEAQYPNQKEIEKKLSRIARGWFW